MDGFLSYLTLGVVQGLTEFLPVSSTGHLILARDFFGFDTTRGLAIDAVLQLATGLAVVTYFWNDYLRIIKAALARVLGGVHDAASERLLIAIVAGTVPAVIVGFLIEDTMETLFRSSTLVAFALIAGSLVMLGAEYTLSKRGASRGVESIGWINGVVVGLFQMLALIPGMSRSGMTISGGIFLGLTREAAARFGFLLSVPIIVGSGLKKLLELQGEGALSVIGPELLLGSVASFLSGLAAIHILLLFVRTRPLYVFIAYRVVLAAAILIIVV